MLGATHACANPLTTRYGTSHGEAIAMLLPTVVRWNESAAADRYEELLRLSKADKTGQYRSPTEALAQRLEQLAASGGLHTRLSKAGISDADLSALAADAAEQWTGTFNPRTFNLAGALEVYRSLTRLLTRSQGIVNSSYLGFVCQRQPGSESAGHSSRKLVTVSRQRATHRSSKSTVPDSLKQIWTYEAGDSIESSAAIVGGTVLIGSSPVLRLGCGAGYWPASEPPTPPTLKNLFRQAKTSTGGSIMTTATAMTEPRRWRSAERTTADRLAVLIGLGPQEHRDEVVPRRPEREDRC